MSRSHDDFESYASFMTHPCAPVFVEAVKRNVETSGEFRVTDQDKLELMAIFGIGSSEAGTLARAAEEHVFGEEIERIFDV